jgi:hypothetical protein
MNYIYEISKDAMIEVRSTGRFVTKKLSMSNKSCKFIEITPIDATLRWTKFVDEQELQVIQYEDEYVAENNILRIV